MEHRWNENDMGKPKYFVHHKFQMDWTGIETGPPWWQADD
jgi:hypothetical protein